MPVLILLALTFLVGIPIALAVLFVRMNKLSAETHWLRSEVTRLRRTLDRGEEEQPSASARLLEARRPFGESAPLADPVPASSPPVLNREPPVIPVAPPEKVPNIAPSEPPAFHSKRAEPEFRLNWEQFLGVKLFAWLGGLALFIGVAFFLKYSFDRNLIPEWLRVLMGFAFGGGLIALGQSFRKRGYFVTAQTLAASGLVILYAVSFVARTHYQLINTPTLFVLMCGITVAGFALAVLMRAQMVAILGVLGGFLTPILVGGQSPNPTVLFGYFGFLNAGLAAIGRRQQWPALLKLGATATIIWELGWCLSRLNSGNAATTLLMFVILNAIYLVSFYLETGGERIAPVAAISIAAFATGATLIAPAQHPSLAFSAVFLGFAAVAALYYMSRSVALAPIAVLGSSILLVLWTEEAAGRVPQEPIGWIASGCILLGLASLLLVRFVEEEAHRKLFASFAAAAPFLLLSYIVGRLPYDSPHVIFAAVLALSAMTVWTAVARKEHLLLPIALAGAVLVQFAWHSQHLSPDDAAAAAWGHLLVFLAFTALPFLLKFRIDESDLIAWRVSAASGPAHFFLIYDCVRILWPDFEYRGLFPAVLGLPAVAMLLVTRSMSTGDRRMRFTGIYGASALFFLTLIFPVQFKNQWLTIGWALEGAALLWLYRRAPLPWLPAAGSLLLAASFARLALNPLIFRYEPRGEMPILNWYLYSYGIVAAALFAAARLVNRETVRAVNLRPIFAAGGLILLFLLMNIEIADVFADGPYLVFDFSRNFARDMTYSLAWGLFALALLAAGVVRNLKAVRVAGIALMAATLVKLFFHDLARLDQLYRIGAFIGLAIMLIFASWLYQRFMGRSTQPKMTPQS